MGGDLTTLDSYIDSATYAWNGEQLFKLTNAQLKQVLDVRKMKYETDANKRALVKTVLDAQIALGIKTEDVAEAGEGLGKTELYSAGALLSGDAGVADVVQKPVADVLYENAQGAVVTLSDVANVAQEASGLSVLEWSALGEQERNEYIDAAIVELGLVSKSAGEELSQQNEQAAKSIITEQDVVPTISSAHVGADEIAVLLGEAPLQTLHGSIDDLVPVV